MKGRIQFGGFSFETHLGRTIDGGCPLAPGVVWRQNTAMNSQAAPDGILARILQSNKSAVVIHGPAGCGKTTAVLEFYRHLEGTTTCSPAASACQHVEDPPWRGALASGQCLLIAANAPAIAALKERLLAAAPGGVVAAPRVASFASLAGRILGACGQPATILPAFGRHLLLRRIVDDLCGKGRLQVLGKVADTPGVIAALDKAIAELKRAAVDPVRLEKAVAAGRLEGKAVDLLAVYRRYQEELQAGKLFDVEGQMWVARDCLLAGLEKDNAAVGLAGIAAVAVDGFIDFTPTQLDILSLLARRLGRVVITLPHCDDARLRMWHWSRRTLNNIRHVFGGNLEEIEACRAPLACSPPVRASSASQEPPYGRTTSQETPDGVTTNVPLAPLWDHAFDVETRGLSLPKDVDIVAAAGIEAEVADAAVRIKRLLREGRGGRVAVLARSLEEYWPVLRRVFASYDIPVAAPAEPLANVPVVRFALDVAALAPGFEFAAVLKVVKSSYFRPGALGEFDAVTVAAAEHIIREGNVLVGTGAYQAAANRLVQRLTLEEGRREEEDAAPVSAHETAGAIESAAKMLERLFEIASGRADGGKAQTLRDVVAAMELPAAALACGDPAIIARDLRALALLNDTLRTACSPANSFAVANDACEHGTLSLAELRDALATIPCPSERRESLVDVLDALDARGIRYDHVFLLGLSEGQFPRPATESSLLGDADRLAYAAGGIHLDSRGDLTAREMLLFYLAISRADHHLTLSYLDSDSSGKALGPSQFMSSLLEPFGGLDAVKKSGQFTRISPGRFLPAEADIASLQDALAAAAAGLFANDQRFHGYASALAWAARNHPVDISRIAGGIWARHRRWAGGEANEYDGRLSEGEVLASLSRRYAPDNPRMIFSASALNTYGQCPWQFFAAYVLHLAPLAQPQRQLEAVGRGIFCHNVLFGMMSLLRDRARGPVCLGELDESAVGEALDQAVAAESRRVEARQPPYPLLWDIQRRQMTRDLRQFVNDFRARGPQAGKSLHFELTFGMDLRGREPSAPESTSEPVVIQTDIGALRLKGKIERVDEISADGRSGLMIVDYKTGGLPSPSDIVAGRNLQVPLYKAAAEALLGRPCLGGVFQRIGGSGKRESFFAGVKFTRGAYVADDGFEQSCREAMARLAQFVTGMGRGRFDLMPTHDCPSYCPYRRICQFSPARYEFKAGKAETDTSPNSGESQSPVSQPGGRP